MTNETTASPPKSIGDDAQDDTKFLAHWDSVSHNYGFDMEFHTAYNAARAAWFAAPAAQASATIQAAPTVSTFTLTGHQLVAALDLLAPGLPRDPEELDDDLTFGVVQHKDDDGTVATGMCCWNDDTDGVLPLDEHPEDAATSQEPVMVAEPVGSGVNDWLFDYKCGLITQSEFITLLNSRAAPMVADPAGVAAALQPFAKIAALYDEREDDSFEIWKDCHEKETRITLGHCRAALAATVKAVPSEALEYRTCCDHPDCATCAGRGGFYRAAPLADKTGGGE